MPLVVVQFRLGVIGGVTRPDGGLGSAVKDEWSSCLILTFDWLLVLGMAADWLGCG